MDIDGYIYGYKYKDPAKKNHHKNFNIVFCELLDNKKWAIVGYYLNAKYAPNGSPESSKVIEQKISDLQYIRKFRSLGLAWKVGEKKMKQMLCDELSVLKWKVEVNNVFSFPESVLIPKELDVPKICFTF